MPEAAKRVDPVANCRFRVEIKDIPNAIGFSEITIAENSTEVIDYRNGNEPTHVRKLSGLTKYGNITMKRGITDSMDIYEWRDSIVKKGAMNNRKNLSIILIDEAGQDAARWDVVEAWIVKYVPGPLDAKGNQVEIEEIELAHEGITRVKP